MIRINTMTSIFKILLSLLVLIIHFEIGYAQTASILPPAETQFLDQNGKPLTSGTVEFFIPGTSTLKMTWRDEGQTIPNTNPVILNSAGRAIIFGDGSYRQVLKDRLGNVIWDGITSSLGSGGGGGGSATVGDGDSVGMIKSWSGFIAPYGYVFAYGQELVRDSYPAAFAALTLQQNVTCASGNPILTGVSDTSQLPIGAPIESSCLNSGATIVSKTINSITASSNAIISTTATARFYPFGNGDGSLTFNVPDLRGRVIAGRDNMGGISANRLPVDFASLGKTGGAAVNTLIVDNLPPYTPAGSIANGAITSTLNNTGGNLAALFNTVGGSVGPATSGGNVIANATSILSVTSSQDTSTFTGVSQGGSSTPFSVVQPTQSYNYIIKVIPDSNSNSFFGVASIGGMYGVINCGTGLTCAGNTISAVGGGGSSDIEIGVTPITGGTTNGLLYKNNSGVVASSNSGNNQVLTTDGSGIPTAVSTLPATNIATNSVDNTKLAQLSSTTLKGNPTNTTANAQDFTIQGLGTATLDPSNDYIPVYNAATGTILKTTPGAIASSGVAGVSSIGGMTGAITCGTGITCTGNDISAVSSGTITVGTTPISGGNTNGLFYKNGSGLFASATTANNQVLTTNGSGVPTVASTLPTVNLPAFTGDVTSVSGTNTLAIGTNSIANTKLQQVPATTLRGNATNATADIQDFTIQSLTTATLNAANDYIPVYNAATNTIRKTTPAAIASSGSLPVIANNTVLGNSSGAPATPTALTVLPPVTANAPTVTATGSTTARNLANRFADVFNVKDYGALGDGSTNDYAAFAAAIADAEPVCGKVFIPQGHYMIDQRLQIPMCVWIQGSGRPSQFTFTGNKGTILDFLNAPAGQDGLYQTSNSLQMSKISDLQVERAPRSCINVRLVYSVIENVTTAYCGLDGIEIAASSGLTSYLFTLRNVFSNHNARSGVTIAATTNQFQTTTIFENVYAMLNGGNGIDISNITSTTFIASAADQSGLNGFSISGSNSVSFIASDAEKNDRAGYYFSNSYANITSSRAVINNQDNVGGYGNYVIDGGSTVSIHDSNDDNNNSTTAISVVNSSLAFIYSGYYAGAITEASGGAAVKAGTLGLFCTGAPSAGFTVKGGIVTQC